MLNQTRLRRELSSSSPFMELEGLLWVQQQTSITRGTFQLLALYSSSMYICFYLLKGFC